MPVDGFDQSGEILLRRRRRQHDERSLPAFDRGFANVLDPVDALEFRDRRFEYLLELVERPRISAGVQEIDRHTPSRLQIHAGTTCIACQATSTGQNALCDWMSTPLS